MRVDGSLYELTKEIPLDKNKKHHIEVVVDRLIMKPDLARRLTQMQHDEHDIIIATLHVHLDHHNCLEVLILKGEAARVRALADKLISCKGVKHGTFSGTTTGQDLA